MKFYLHTLGCPENLVDAEEMASRLLQAGEAVRALAGVDVVLGTKRLAEIARACPTASRLRAIQE